MYELISLPQDGDKPTFYEALNAQVKALLHGESNRIANAANLCSLLFHSIPQVNWVGFYFLEGDELVVGPFQGKPACIRIAMGRGVCGTAAQERRTQIVGDVSQFSDHIPCDAESRSEIVVPLQKDGRLIGVLDVDAPVTNRFDPEDAQGLQQVVTSYMEAVEIP